MSAREILEDMKSHTKFKNNRVEAPLSYLGAKLEKKVINSHKVWTITSHMYVKAAISNVKAHIRTLNMRLPTRISMPMTSNYVPELDATPELSSSDTQYYQELIGILRWATELGRVDILLEVSLLSQYQVSPCEGHMEQALHIFGYLKKNPKLM